MSNFNCTRIVFYLSEERALEVFELFLVQQYIYVRNNDVNINNTMIY